MPGVLSVLATHDIDGYVPGIDNLLNGYTHPDGTVHPSADEKIARGRKAIAAFADFRAHHQSNPEQAAKARAELEEHMPYFGYGYLKSKEELVPPVPMVYWSFRLMVGLGSFLFLFLIVAWWMQHRGTLERTRWMHWLGIAAVPMVYVAGQAGWIVAEVGRQPWAIQDLLPVGAAVSQLSPTSVMTTFFLFLIIFTVLLVAEVRIMTRAISKHEA